MAQAGKSILIIEDEADTNLFLETALKGEGYRAQGVLSGREGLERLQQDDSVDLVLLDIMMHDIDGIETCRQIREQRDAATLPVCMITASVDIEKVVESFKAGANGYIVKPFELDELLNKVRELTAAANPA